MKSLCTSVNIILPVESLCHVVHFMSVLLDCVPACVKSLCTSVNIILPVESLLSFTVCFT